VLHAVQFSPTSHLPLPSLSQPPQYPRLYTPLLTITNLEMAPKCGRMWDWREDCLPCFLFLETQLHVLWKRVPLNGKEDTSVGEWRCSSCPTTHPKAGEDLGEEGPGEATWGADLGATQIELIFPLQKERKFSRDQGNSLSSSISLQSSLSHFTRELQR
jgi:hypothetical protein